MALVPLEENVSKLTNYWSNFLKKSPAKKHVQILKGYKYPLVKDRVMPLLR